MIQIDPVPFLDTFPPPSTAIETLRLLEGVPASDPNEFSSSYPSSVPSSSQPSASSIGEFYDYSSAAPPPIEPSASWFGEHSNTSFIATPDNHTEELFDYSPFTSEEPAPETDSVFFGEPPSTIFTTSDGYAEESIDHQMECSVWAPDEESLFFSESAGVLVDQPPITAPVEPITAPVEPIMAPVEPIMAPVESITAPVEPVTAPVEPSSPTLVFDEALNWKDTDSVIDKDMRNAIYRSLKTSPWKRPFLLIKCIFAGSYWVGIANPFEASQVDQRENLTNSLLAAIEVEGTTLQYLLSKPRKYLPLLLRVII
jgi:hypothetical protein